MEQYICEYCGTIAKDPCNCVNCGANLVIKHKNIPPPPEPPQDRIIGSRFPRVPKSELATTYR